MAVGEDDLWPGWINPLYELRRMLKGVGVGGGGRLFSRNEDIRYHFSRKESFGLQYIDLMVSNHMER